MKPLAMLTLLFCLLLSCHKEGVTVLPGNSSILVGFKIGQERTVNVEDKSPKTLHIKFTDIKEGRCTEENCSSCYGGYVYAYFDVWGDTGHDSLTLMRISCVEVSNASFENPVVDRKDIRGLRIGLATISVHQNSTTKYTSQLLIAKL